MAAADAGAATLSIYRWSSNRFDRVSSALDHQPQRLAAADLDGDRLDDLALTDTLGNRVSIVLQRADGAFVGARHLEVGVTPSDLTFANIDGLGDTDLVVSSRSSGDVVVLFNDSARSLARSASPRSRSARTCCTASSNSS